ncbi:MAG: AMP-binding protein, partial [bacterium]|nr:AMP-binding protein [bacterium]
PLAWGGRVILARDALELPALPAAAEVRLVNTVPSAITELVRLEALPPSVRTVNLAGEVLKGAVVEGLYRRETIRRVFNLYGPSEDTTYSTCVRVEPRGGEPTIGRPVAGTRAYVLDRRLRPVAIGVVGELYLEGAGLARGYLGRPQRTAAGFVPNPFRHRPERRNAGRLYRTGDLVRRLPDGALEFLGRMDHQVKIRGFRIELGEIEAALGRHPAVGEAVVLAGDGGPPEGDKRLVAFLTPSPQADEGPPDAGELRGFLKQTLPDYMVPAAFVVLPALPLTPNGKVDRIALDRRTLPASERDRVDSEAAFEAPRTPTQEVLAGIWSQILRREPIGAGHDFFELGGHSLLATQVISRVREAFGLELPVRQLFETPTLASFAEVVEAKRGDQRAPAVPPLRPAVPDGDGPWGPVPLSFAQERLWFLDQLAPGSSAYNMYSPFQLQGALDLAALRSAFTAIVRRHETLRTTFRSVDGEPRQVIAPPFPLPVPVVDLGALPQERREAELGRLSAAEGLRPFELTRGPLLRAPLVRLGADRHALLLNVHHIVSDGWSTGILFRELVSLYEAFTRREAEAGLPALEIQYADFAVWQRGWLAGEALEAELAYWKGKLAGAPEVLDLPLDRPRPVVQTFRGGARALRVPAEVAQGLKTLGRRGGATA